MNCTITEIYLNIKERRDKLHFKAKNDTDSFEALGMTVLAVSELAGKARKVLDSIVKVLLTHAGTGLKRFQFRQIVHIRRRNLRVFGVSVAAIRNYLFAIWYHGFELLPVDRYVIPSRSFRVPKPNHSRLPEMKRNLIPKAWTLEFVCVVFRILRKGVVFHLVKATLNTVNRNNEDCLPLIRSRKNDFRSFQRSNAFNKVPAPFAHGLPSLAMLVFSKSLCWVVLQKCNVRRKFFR